MSQRVKLKSQRVKGFSVRERERGRSLESVWCLTESNDSRVKTDVLSSQTDVLSSQTSQLVKHIRSRTSHRHRPVSSRLITSVYVILGALSCPCPDRWLITSVYITLGALSCPRPDRWLITFVYIIVIPAPRSVADQTSGLPPVELFVRVTCGETQSRVTTSRTVRPRAGEQPHGQ